MAATVPLIERKRRRARARIVRAADELFAARGYDNVSVSDIATHAEVGRSTFFRHFGDKPEVVFAKQQELLDAIAAARDVSTACPRSAVEALEQVRPIVLDLCAQVTSDVDGYRRHYALLADHAELRGRDALKFQQFAGALDDLLEHRGCDPGIARLAAELALACVRTTIGLANDPMTFRDDVDATFDRVLTLGHR